MERRRKLEELTVPEAPPFREFCDFSAECGNPELDLQAERRIILDALREPRDESVPILRSALKKLLLILWHLSESIIAALPGSKLQASVIFRKPLRGVVALITVCSFFLVFRLYWLLMPAGEKCSILWTTFP